MPVPLLIYADFEAITEKIDASVIIPNLILTNIRSTQDAAMAVCCHDDKYTKPVKIYRGEDYIKKFTQEMLNEVQYC